jgi:endoglucanase
MISLLSIATLSVIASVGLSLSPPYGQLSVKGTKIIGANGQEVALHGMSLFWSQWDVGSIFYNRETVQAVKCSWNSNLIRAAMGVEEGGYLTDPATNKQRLETVVQAAIDLGIYVIIGLIYKFDSRFIQI